LLVIAAQQIGDGPDEGGEVLLVHGEGRVYGNGPGVCPNPDVLSC
jgi:hypothetical protein